MPSTLGALALRYIPPFLMSSRIYDELAEIPPEIAASQPVPAAPWTVATKTPSGQRRPQTIAHRGYKAKFPENTLASFRGAVEAGADALETDIHLTKDGVVVLSHDGNLKRCYGHDEKIIDVDFEFVKKLRTIAKPNEPMPRLKDLLEYLAQDGNEKIWVMLDIKLDNDSDTVMRRIGETIASVPAHPSRPWEARVTMGVWAYKYLPLCARHVPAFPVAHIGFSTQYAARFMDSKHANVGFNLLTQCLYLRPKFIVEAHAAKRPVFAWTVNTDDWMRWCVREELDGVITDDPKRFLEIKAEWEQGKRKVNLGSAIYRQVVWLWMLMALFGVMLRVRTWRKGTRVDGKSHR